MNFTVYFVSFLVAILITFSIFLFIFVGAFFSLKKNMFENKNAYEDEDLNPAKFSLLKGDMLIHNNIEHKNDDDFYNK